MQGVTCSAMSAVLLFPREEPWTVRNRPVHDDALSCRHAPLRAMGLYVPRRRGQGLPDAIEVRPPIGGPWPIVRSWLRRRRRRRREDEGYRRRERPARECQVDEHWSERPPRCWTHVPPQTAHVGHQMRAVNLNVAVPPSVATGWGRDMRGGEYSAAGWWRGPRRAPWNRPR